MTLRYLIATNPRSGSGFLCDLLHKSGEAGMRPYTGIGGWEYLGTHMESSEDRPPREILDEAFRRSAHGGVEGFKLMWPDLAALLRQGDDTAETDALREQLKRLQWIRLRRRDQLALAVSWAKAVQKQHWNSTKKPRSNWAQYNYWLIARRLEEARRNERAWDRWFEQTAIEPLELVYEDYLLDLPGTLSRIARHLGMEGGLECRVEATNYRKQRDGSNQDWKARFQRDQRNRFSRSMAVARSIFAVSTWREAARRAGWLPDPGRRARARAGVSGR